MKKRIPSDKEKLEMSRRETARLSGLISRLASVLHLKGNDVESRMRSLEKWANEKENNE